MIAQLEQVVFDHDTNAVVDGLSLRVDRSTPATEWIRGGATPSPAAYALAPTTGQAIAIQAQFSFPDVGNFTGPAVAIRAKAEDPDNAPFGVVEATVVPIPFATVHRRTPLVPMALGQLRFLDLGVGRYPMTLRWQFQLEPGGPWLDFDSSDHVIYLTLDLPGEPWAPRSTPADLLRVPWTRVLDWSCTWASGVTIDDGDLDAAVTTAMKRIEGALNKLGQRANVPLQFQESGAAGAYAMQLPQLVAFLCTKFLRLLDGDTAPEIDTQVDCSDCAAALVVFANVLGGDLSSRRVNPRATKASFQTNRVVSIGRKPKGYPFVFHEVAVRGAAGAAVSSVHVFDASLMIDRDADPSRSDPAHKFGLSKGLTLATAALPPATFRYVHRLVDEDDWPGLSFTDVSVRCLDQCDAGLVGQVDAVTMNLYQGFSGLIEAVVPAGGDGLIARDLRLIPLAGYVAYHQDVETPQFSALGTLLVRSADFYYVALSDDARKSWRRVVGRKPVTPAVADDRGRSVTKAVVADRRIRLSMGLASTPAEAREALAWILAQGSLPLSLRKSDGRSMVGDAVFTGPRDGSVYFVRGNAITRLMNLGRSPARLMDLARAVDLAVSKR